MTGSEFNAQRRTGNGMPETSLEAARSLESPPSRHDLTAKQKAVLSFLTRAPGGLADHELLARYHAAIGEGQDWPLQSESGLRSRRAELTAYGFVRDSRRRVVLPSRRQAIVWEATPAEALPAPLEPPATPTPEPALFEPPATTRPRGHYDQEV